MNIPSKQKSLFPEFDLKEKGETQLKSRSGTFIDNMRLPIHRWFRYSAGFSAEWAAQEIEKRHGRLNVLDPFAGSGITLLAAESDGVNAVGFESHPFIYRVARAKLNWNIDHNTLRKRYLEILNYSKENIKESERIEIPLLGKCFTQQALNKLDSLKDAYTNKLDDGSRISELVWLAITGIIRACSSAGTAPWQYVLPNKKKSKVLEPYEAFAFKMEQFIQDILYAKHNSWATTSKIILADARAPKFKVKEKFDLVITSPPYPNNYDYADATRLEMTFWGEITGWGDLHNSVRQYLIRSCSQHSAKDRLILDDLLKNDVLNPIKSELSKACLELEKIRLTKGGKKTYHTMAAAYFNDLGEIFKTLRPICKKKSRLCFVVGDSAPYGVYLAVDKWLGELALAAGFKSYSFEKLRDRNIKWKNRKHNVPLHEGRLWIDG